MSIRPFPPHWPTRAIAILLLCVLTIGLVIAQLWRTHEHSQNQLQANQTRLQLAQQELSRLSAEARPNLAVRKAQNQRPAPNIGDEDRRAWREQLVLAKQQAGLKQLHYELGPRLPVPTNLALSDSLRLFRSKMETEFDFTHEVEFLSFIETLHQAPGAQLIARECELTRRPQTDNHETSGILHARCQIDWLTLDREEARGRER